MNLLRPVQWSGWVDPCLGEGGQYADMRPLIEELPNWCKSFFIRRHVCMYSMDHSRGIEGLGQVSN
jgi:hypothetical protein